MPVGTFLLNEKRQQLESIQRRHKVRVLVIPNPNMETPNYDLQRLRDDDPQVASLELSIDVQASTPAPEPEVVRAKQAEMREQALVTDIKPKTPAPERTPESAVTTYNDQDEGIGRKKRPDSQRRRQSKPQQSLITRVVGFLFGDAEEPQTNSRPSQNRSRGDRARLDRSKRSQNQQSPNNRGPKIQETERTADGEQGGRRRRRRRSKNRADNPEIMKTEGQTPQTQVSQEREDELKAHEEDLAPRPKRAERKQRGENAIASHEARLETHTTTSGETTIDDAPVLNEGLMSESEKPKRPRRGRHGSRQTNGSNETPKAISPENVTAASKVTTESTAPQSDPTMEPRPADAPTEDKPRPTRRGRGRPRKSEAAVADNLVEVAVTAPVDTLVEEQQESTPATEIISEVAEESKKKPARRGRKPKAKADEVTLEETPELTSGTIPEEPAPEKSPDEAIQGDADKQKRSRGRGRRRAPEATVEGTSAPSASDLKAQLLDDGAETGSPAATETPEKPKRGRGRGRPRKVETEAEVADPSAKVFNPPE